MPTIPNEIAISHLLAAHLQKTPDLATFMQATDWVLLSKTGA
jgi:hypothetical protein